MSSEKRRQKEESNYYFILGLDFRKPELSKKVIERVFEEKKAEWSRNLINVGKKAEAERGMELTQKNSEFENIMLDDDIDSPDRIKEAEAAKKIADDEINRYINFFCGIKQIKTSGIETYIKSNAKYLITIEDFRKRLKGYEIEEVNDIEKEHSSYRGIEEKLKIIKKKTLYEFLLFYVKDKKEYRNPDSSKWTLDDIYNLNAKQIMEIADKLYHEMLSKQNKSEKQQAMEELAGECRILLGNPRNKEEYDNYLNSLILPDEICKEIVVFGINGSIDAVQAKELMKYYAKLKPGLSEVEIKENLKKEFIRRNILDYEFPQGLDGGSIFQRCHCCNRLVGRECKYCTSCGHSFFWQCIHCGAEVEDGFDDCPVCGTSKNRKSEQQEQEQIRQQEQEQIRQKKQEQERKENQEQIRQKNQEQIRQKKQEQIRRENQEQEKGRQKEWEDRFRELFKQLKQENIKKHQREKGIQKKKRKINFFGIAFVIFVLLNVGLLVMQNNLQSQNHADMTELEEMSENTESYEQSSGDDISTAVTEEVSEDSTEALIEEVTQEPDQESAITMDMSEWLGQELNFNQSKSIYNYTIRVPDFFRGSGKNKWSYEWRDDEDMRHNMYVMITSILEYNFYFEPIEFENRPAANDFDHAVEFCESCVLQMFGHFYGDEQTVETSEMVNINGIDMLRVTGKIHDLTHSIYHYYVAYYLVVEDEGEEYQGIIIGLVEEEYKEKIINYMDLQIQSIQKNSES